MSTSHNPGDEPSLSPKRSTVTLLFRDIGNTTWRMFIPTIGLAVIGNHFDGIYGTEPWLAVAGGTIGAVIAGILIMRQFQNL